VHSLIKTIQKEGEKFNYDEPYEKRFWFKGVYKRMEWMHKKPSNQITLFRSGSKYHTHLRIRKGRKVAEISQNGLYYRTSEDISKRKYKYTEETKIICGYKCYKAEYKEVNNDDKHYVYYTQEFDAPMDALLLHSFNGLRGYPMEYNDIMYDKEYIYSATEISFDNIDESLFQIPEEYIIIDDENWEYYYGIDSTYNWD
jgi:hypothetical protein